MPLFFGQDWFYYEQGKRTEVEQTVRNIPNSALNGDEVQLIESVIQRVVVKPLELKLDEKRFVVGEQVDLGASTLENPGAWNIRGVRPPGSNGIEVILEIPFEGSEELFNVRPTSYTSLVPQGEIRGSKINIIYRVPQHAQDQIRAQSERDVANLQTWINNINSNVNNLNQQLRGVVAVQIQQRRAQVAQTKKLLDDLNC